jgi:hypothetical protein
MVAGCGLVDDGTGAAVKETACNSPYFEYKQGDCCLDKNTNSICDSDEDSTETTTETTETTTETTETTTETTETETETTEVEITVDDECTDTTYFECLTSYITKDELFFKLKVRRDGYTHLNKISALGCEKTFIDKDKANQGFQVHTETVISIPCKKATPGDEFDNFDYVLEYIFYPKVGMDADTGDWTGKERFPMRSTGKISGTTRNEPKKIY